MPDTQLPLDASWPIPDRRGLPDRRRTARGGRRHTDPDEAPYRVACPHCGDIASYALPHHQTSAEQLTDAFWRRRRCAGCQQVYDTAERVEASPSQKPLKRVEVCAACGVEHGHAKNCNMRSAPRVTEWR